MLAIEYRYFYQSALDTSIRKASQNLNINSSAIERQIQKLEDRLQTKLFIRNARGLELTEEGKLLFDHLSIQNETNQNYSILYSLDGYDEISLTTQTKVIQKDKELLISPIDFGVNKVNSNQIIGGNDIKSSANIFWWN